MREAEKLEQALPEAEREAWVAEHPVQVQGGGRKMVEYQLHAVTFLQWAIRQPILANQEEREQLDVEARTFEESRTPAEQLKYLTTFRGEGGSTDPSGTTTETGDDTGTGSVKDSGDVRTTTDDGRGENVGSTPDEGGTELGGATDAASDTTTEPAAEDTVVEEEQRRKNSVGDEEKAAEIAQPYVALTDAMKSGLKARTRAAC